MRCSSGLESAGRLFAGIKQDLSEIFVLETPIRLALVRTKRPFIGRSLVAWVRLIDQFRDGSFVLVNGDLMIGQRNRYRKELHEHHGKTPIPQVKLAESQSLVLKILSKLSSAHFSSPAPILEWKWYKAKNCEQPIRQIRWPSIQRFKGGSNLDRNNIPTASLYDFVGGLSEVA